MNTIGFRLLFLSLVALAVFSCAKEEPGTEGLLIGKWILSARMVDNVAETLTECETKSTIEFQANNLCILYDACTAKSTNSGWNYRNGMLNISKHLPAGYYIEQIDPSVLRIRRNDISGNGALKVTLLTYSKGLD